MKQKLRVMEVSQSRWSTKTCVPRVAQCIHVLCGEDDLWPHPCCHQIILFSPTKLHFPPYNHLPVFEAQADGDINVGKRKSVFTE